MGKIKIVTDSTVDISDELIQKYGIEMVPLSLYVNGENFLDRVDITPSEFISKMIASKELPKSSQPATGDFLRVYDRLHREGYKVLSIHMTGGMSGTVRSAETAAEMSEGDVTVVDSRYISKALGFQVIEAAKMANEGKSLEEIIARLDEIRMNTRLYVVVDTLENLVKGGRIGKGKAMLGSLLNIKPIASLEGGEYTPVSKARSHSQIVKYLVNRFSEDVKGKTIKAVGITHADGLNLATRLMEEIRKETGFSGTEIAETTPIISTHTGIGAIGFMYYFEP